MTIAWFRKNISYFQNARSQQFGVIRIVEARPFNFDLATSAKKKKDNWLAPDKSIFKINFESNLLLSVQKTTFKDC